MLKFNGFGKLATGGSRKIFYVTNLNLSGPGSFYQAVIEESGPRIVIIDVDGELLTTDTWEIVNGDLTIWCEKNFSLAQHGRLRIYASNVIIYGLQLIGGPNVGSGNESPIWIGRATEISNPIKNIVVDHCAILNGYDETVYIGNAQNVTVKNTIVQGRIDSSNSHGLVVDGDCGATNITLKHNIIQGYLRVPRITGGNVEVIECVLAFGQQDFMEFRPHVPANINVEQCYAIFNSTSNYYDALFEMNANDSETTQEAINISRIYFNGNLERKPDGIILENNTRFIGGTKYGFNPVPNETLNRTYTRHNFPTKPTFKNANQSLMYVLSKVGTPTRNTEQQAIIDKINGTIM